MSVANNILILSIETSCDDTSVAVVSADSKVYSCLTHSQIEEHKQFGGVVPEIASRNHSIKILPLVDAVLSEAGVSFKDLSGIAVTNRPGLLGSLMVGLVTAKTLSFIHKLPIIGVNHLEGHIFSCFLNNEDWVKNNIWQNSSSSKLSRFLSLIVSGGHTSLYMVNGFGEYSLLGRTIDDAAGEAFDKMAKFVGLGYPGGAAIDKAAQFGDPKAYKFPRPMAKEATLNMSFSGLKTSLVNRFTKEKLMYEDCTPEKRQQWISDLSASYQEAIVDVLINRVDRAVNQLNGDISMLTIVGGVSANSRLRKLVSDWSLKTGVPFKFPELKYCCDNAAMIGLVGANYLRMGKKDNQSLGAFARAPL